MNCSCTTVQAGTIYGLLVSGPCQHSALTCSSMSAATSWLTDKAAASAVSRSARRSAGTMSAADALRGHNIRRGAQRVQQGTQQHIKVPDAQGALAPHCLKLHAAWGGRTGLSAWLARHVSTTACCCFSSLPAHHQGQSLLTQAQHLLQSCCCPVQALCRGHQQARLAAQLRQQPPQRAATDLQGWHAGRHRQSMLQL